MTPTSVWTAVLGHGALVSPPSRNAVDRFLPAFLHGQSPQTPCTCPNRYQRNATGDHGSRSCDQGFRSTAGGQPCLWWSQGCTIGCDRCDGVNVQSHGVRLCNSTLQPTLPAWARTMSVGGGEDDAYRYHPWRAPGSAPVDDACGRAGGTSPTHAGGSADAVFTNTSIARMGELGSRVLPYAPSGAVWHAGDTVEVAWGITYNHGGGYQYRLCPQGEPLSEACFQRTPLAFDRTRQALVWNNGTRHALNGVFVDEGTTPAGSTWARNPVPRVGEKSAGCLPRNGSTSGDHGDCASFAPPCPQDCTGQPGCAHPATTTDPGTQQGECSGDWKGGSVIDGLIVPDDLPTGQYVLGWRWDCEETTQIWLSCADITICRRGEPCEVPPPYTPPPPPTRAALVEARAA